jgi:hypothetical protein
VREGGKRAPHSALALFSLRQFARFHRHSLQRRVNLKPSRTPHSALALFSHRQFARFHRLSLDRSVQLKPSRTSHSHFFHSGSALNFIDSA